jgi:hypothetical protein
MEGNMAAAITMPNVNRVQNNMMAYGAGLVSGIGYNVISGITGSGLIGGAVASAVAGAMVEGVLGQMIAVNAGFAQGQRGLGAFGMGNLLGGLGGVAKTPANGNNVINTI